QYQHDVDQNALKHSLDETVMSCVNKVGVELNTASKQLLTYVSGLGPSLAENIVNYRNTNGAFGSREELKEVPRLGGKAFEQAAGFIRIRGAKNPLDTSAVHPESYWIVEKMAKDLDVSVTDLMSTDQLRKKIKLDQYVTDTVGLPTLKDILDELSKPGRDPRAQFEAFSFQDGVEEISDLRPGMKLPGIVTNITKFGAFVDIGVHQDGLIHLSEMANRFISDRSEVVKVQQKVEVTVLEVDAARKRISLSMKGEAGGGKPKSNNKGKNQRPRNRRKEEPQTDLAAKLAALKGKFNG
ncbi:MAG: helix-hairpin-helix domain-containing protein, partial [Cyclobacteriaceae bacterium]